MDAARAHVYVEGLVQGVNFRAECAREARRHGLAGWVRNLADGRVEAVFEGEEARVQRLVEWCGRGPAHAAVENLSVSWESPDGADDGFRIVRS